MGCEVDTEICHVSSEPEQMDGVAELLVAAGRRRQVLVCNGLAVRGAACKVELISLGPWTAVDLEMAVTAAGSVIGRRTRD